MKNFSDEYEDKKMTAEAMEELKKQNTELKLCVKSMEGKIRTLQATVNALAFAVRCNGVSGESVKWEDMV